MRTSPLVILLAALSSVGAASLRSRKIQESRFTVCGRITCDTLYEVCTVFVDTNEYSCICKDEEKSFPNCGPAPTEVPLDPQFFADKELNSNSHSVAKFNPPSSSPSKPLSEMPSAEPSLNPSNLPSQQQSENPSSEPSENPSMTPSDLPSSIPSGIPSQVPTLPADASVLPTLIQIPTFPPHSEMCSVEVETHCTTDMGATACDSIVPRMTQCEGPPTALMFRYLGGSCVDQASTPQSKSLIQCQDFSGGPPAKKGVESFHYCHEPAGYCTSFGLLWRQEVTS